MPLRRSADKMSGPGSAAHIVNIERCSTSDITATKQNNNKHSETRSIPPRHAGLLPTIVRMPPKNENGTFGSLGSCCQVYISPRSLGCTVE